MKFDQLQAAIANRADQSPSIYMALCMIEALFLDIERAAGTDLCQCPVGSEKLANKLVWLSKSIQEIYKENDSELQSNRARLDQLMGKLDTASRELETMSDIQTRLDRLSREYEAVMLQLNDSKQRKARYDELCGLYAQAKEKQAQLQGPDASALDAELATLNKSVAQLEREQAEKKTSLQAAQARRDSLAQAVEVLETQCASIQQSVESLQKEQADRAAQIDSHSQARNSAAETLARQEKILGALAEENSRLSAQLDANAADLAAGKQKQEETAQRLQATAAEQERLCAQLRELEEQDRENSQTLEQLKAQHQAVQAQCASREQEKEDMTAQLQAQEAACQQHIKENRLCKEQLEDLTEKISSFIAEELTPLQASLEQHRQELAGLEQQKEGLEQEHRSLQASRTELTIQVAQKKDETDALRDKLALSQSELDALRQEEQQLQAQRSSNADSLAQLQEAVRELKDVRLPEVLRCIQQEKFRQQELQDTMEKNTAQLAEYVRQTAQLEAEAPGLQEQLEQHRIEYDKLSASSIAQNNDLQSLQEKINELQALHSDSQRELLRSQLRETLRKLEEIAADCDRLTQENRARQEELDAQNATRQNLQETKQKLAQDRETLQNQLHALNFAGYETYKKDLAALERQLGLLITVRDNLGSSLKLIRESVALPPVSDAGMLEDSFAQTLRELRTHVNGLQKKLLACAQSVKLEELQ